MADDDQHRRSDDETMPVVLHRLGALERRVDAGFLHLDQRLDGLAFLPLGTWTEREAARDQQVEALKEDIKGAKALGMWAVGLVAGLVLTSLVGFLLFVAQSGAAS